MGGKGNNRKKKPKPRKNAADRGQAPERKNHEEGGELSGADSCRMGREDVL